MGSVINRRRKGARNERRARDYLKLTGARTVVKSSDSALDLVAFYPTWCAVVESTDASHRARARRRLLRPALPKWVYGLIFVWRPGQSVPKVELVHRGTTIPLYTGRRAAAWGSPPELVVLLGSQTAETPLDRGARLVPS